MIESGGKPDRRWALKGRLIIVPGVLLIFGGLGLDIFDGDLGWIGRLMAPVGAVISFAGVAKLRQDREQHFRDK